MDRHFTPHGYQDVPAGTDALGLDAYFDGLARFIRCCETPMTIAIQGGWGSGKTSAIRIIQKKLAADNILSVDFNTWQYSRSAPGALFVPLLLQMIDDVDKTAEARMQPEAFRQFKKQFIDKKSALHRTVGAFVGALLTGASAATDAAAPILGVAENLSESLSQEKTKQKETEALNRFNFVKLMREQLESKIRYLVEGDGGDIPGVIDRVVFYIDDLDRLRPEVAVEFLEDIKNYMECDHCVFVLALDHEIVYKGLQQKYGVNGEKLESEYAEHFFDKIIQLPFSIPSNRYDIQKYLKALLPDSENIERFAAVINGFGDTNPRSIKRVFNILQLYQNIPGGRFLDNESLPKLFALLLLQTNHVRLYQELVAAVRQDRGWRMPSLFDTRAEQPPHVRAWRLAKRSSQAEQAACEQIAAVFALPGEDGGIDGYGLLFDMIGDTAITGADAGSRLQASAETKQTILEYLALLGFEPEANEPDKFFRPEDAHNAGRISVQLTTPGEANTNHVNLNIYTGELQSAPSAAAKARLESLLASGEDFKVSINLEAPQDGMDILHNRRGVCVLRNISRNDLPTMRFVGRVLRSIRETGALFSDAQ